MTIELAPMEGITSYVYRQALNQFYGGVDTYFTPFISTHKDKKLNFKEKNEIRPENNKGMKLVPQVLTINADEFLFTSGQIAGFGYDHININFGCPSGTVTSKGKGSGALLDIDKLDRFLDEVFNKSDLKISIKTRMGFENASEFEKILEVYSRYPLYELIIHARVREDFYNGDARVGELSDVIKSSSLAEKNVMKTSLSYNGDVWTISDYDRICDTFSDFDACMIGRGIISRPWLAAEIKGENKTEIDRFKAFNHALVTGYDAIMPGEKNTLFKLKELWIYMIKPFEDEILTASNGITAKKLLKSIRKCNSLKEYELIINTL